MLEPDAFQCQLAGEVLDLAMEIRGGGGAVDLVGLVAVDAGANDEVKMRGERAEARVSALLAYTVSREGSKMNMARIFPSMTDARNASESRWRKRMNQILPPLLASDSSKEEWNAFKEHIAKEEQEEAEASAARLGRMRWETALAVGPGLTFSSMTLDEFVTRELLSAPTMEKLLEANRDARVPDYLAGKGKVKRRARTYTWHVHALRENCTPETHLEYQNQS